MVLFWGEQVYRSIKAIEEQHNEPNPIFAYRKPFSKTCWHTAGTATCRNASIVNVNGQHAPVYVLFQVNILASSFHKSVQCTHKAGKSTRLLNEAIYWPLLAIKSK